MHAHCLFLYVLDLNLLPDICDQVDSIAFTNLGDDMKHQEDEGTKSTNQKNLREMTKKQMKSGPQDQQGKQQPIGRQGPAADQKVIQLTVNRL